MKWPFSRRKQNTTGVTLGSSDGSISNLLLQALLNPEQITKETALNIPGVAACVNRIASTISQLEVKLYRRVGAKVEEIDDSRAKMLNGDSGDTLNGTEIKKAMVADMLLDKGGYCFIDKVGEEVHSLRYVAPEYVYFAHNTDPIFKDYQIEVEGKRYESWQFIRLLHSTKNGYWGTPVIAETSKLMNIVYAMEKFQGKVYTTNGMRGGYLQTEKKLDQESINALRNGFRKLYGDGSERTVILNDGLQFKEASATAAESQLDESTKTLNDLVCEVFLIPPSIIKGGSNVYDRKLYNEGCILPILEEFETALNTSLLDEDEKDEYFFAFDTDDLLKADLKERYEAYQIAEKNGFLQIDEIRKKENLPALGLPFIKLNLSDVLYDTDKKTIFTPNTGVQTDLEKSKATEPEQNNEPEQAPKDNAVPEQNITPDEGEEKDEKGEPDENSDT